MKTENRGGQRKGAGRKPLNEKKLIMVGFYVPSEYRNNTEFKKFVKDKINEYINKQT